MKPKHRIFKVLEVCFLATVIGSFAIAIIAYVIKFGGRPIGEPEAWGQFGDFVGGVVNPMIGIATVIFVWLTLHEARGQAAEARGQQRRDDEKAAMQKRMEWLLEEWNSHIASTLISPLLAPPEKAATIRDFLTSEHGVDNAESIFDKTDDVAEKFNRHHQVARSILAELGSYLSQYDVYVGSIVLTDFYRRRVYRAVELFKSSGGLSDATVSKLTETSHLFQSQGSEEVPDGDEPFVPSDDDP